MMKSTSGKPSGGQLVWCPSDPALGVGVVTEVEGGRVRVRFWRLQEERAYTTRGESVLSRYEIKPGELVRRRDGASVRVAGRIDSDHHLLMYELEDGSAVAENELVPNVRDIGAKERLSSLSLVHPEVIRARIQGLGLGEIGVRPGVAAILGARALWLPHQVDVATRAIEQDPVRMLLADEVGLGKTVEAALIYAGLRYEGRADRILILTPDALSIQWLGEIYRKAHELLVLLDEDRIKDARTDFPDLSPFEAHQRVVASIDRVCADEELAAQAAAAPWDLVVVDEAHHLKWNAKSGGNAA
ncbi:MAG: SNF2-related protein [Myxococcota bacterium]